MGYQFVVTHNRQCERSTPSPHERVATPPMTGRCCRDWGERGMVVTSPPNEGDNNLADRLGCGRAGRIVALCFTSLVDPRTMELIGRHPLAVANRCSTSPMPIACRSAIWHFKNCCISAMDGCAAEARPLVRGGFQAWEHGPVSQAVYTAFRASADRPINTRAMLLISVPTRKKSLQQTLTTWSLKLMRDVLRAYGHLHPYELSRITHEPGSPW